MKTFKDLQEKLKQSDDISKWIDDFVNSDDPKFSGKSKDERIKMAKGAYYGAQKEETELQEKGLWDNIHAKRKRIKAGSGEKMRKPGSKGAPTAQDFKDASEEVKKDDLPFEPDAPKKNPSAKAGKYGLGHSIAKHLARQAMKKLAKEETVEESRGHKLLATKLANMDRMKNVQIPTPQERKAELEKQKEVKKEQVMLSLSDFVKEGFVSAAQRKAVWASKNEKGIKEEELDEVTSPMQKLRDAHERHMQKALAANKAGDDEATKVHQKYMQKITDKMNKLKKNEEIDLTEMEELCEISKSTLASYIPKAAQSARLKGQIATDFEHKAKSSRNPSTKSSWERLHMKYKNKAWDREDNIAKAANKLAKEEVEHLAEADIAAIKSEYKKNESDNRHTENAALLAKHFGSKSDQNKVAKAKAYRDKKGGYGGDAEGRHHSNVAYEVHKKLYHHIKEEVEQIDELDKKTLGSYVKKAADDYSRRETRISRALDKNLLDPNVDRAVVKQDKRKVGMHKAIDKLTKEEVEELDELDKKTLGNYVKKSHDQLMKHTASVNMKYGRGDKDATAYALDKDALRKTANRTKGMGQAINKLTKEETEEQKKAKDDLDLKLKQWRSQQRAQKALNKEETMISYKDFVATLNEELKGKQHKLDKNKNGKLDSHDFKLLRKEEEEIEEAKIDDLKDRMALKKANQSAYDKGYKPEPKSNVVKVKGHSYGAGEDEGEDDDDTKKVSKPAAPEVKRGRGRPTGSKSGARR